MTWSLFQELFETIIYSITLFLLAVSLILVSFIMAVLLSNDNGILKTLRNCAVLLVTSIAFAMQVVCDLEECLSGPECRDGRPGVAGRLILILKQIRIFFDGLRGQECLPLLPVVLQ